jgi:hypothetical protein
LLREGNIYKFTKEEAMPKLVEEKNKVKTKEPRKKTKNTEKANKENSSNKGKAVVKKSTVRSKKEVAKKENRIIKEEDLRKNIKENKPKYLNEYYDLPYRYDETVVTILAQTPKRLFVYWDVSDNDKEKYRKAFGEDFFEKTYPVLLIHNEELNYTFEVPINDFANSWYLDIKDSKTKYVVQLGRKFRNVRDVKLKEDIQTIKEENINLQNDFLYITDSNKLEAPNDHILFERLGNQITYRNMKDKSEFNKDISVLVSKLQGTYPKANVKNLYKEFYGEEIYSEMESRISNPGSGSMPTSGMF